MSVFVIRYCFSFFGLLSLRKINMVKSIILGLKAWYLVNKLLGRGEWSRLHACTDLIFKHACCWLTRMLHTCVMAFQILEGEQ